MDKTTGKIVKVAQKQDKYGIQLEDQRWFNDFGTCIAKKGDEVEIDYEVNNNFNNIKNLKITKSGQDQPKERSGVDEATRLRRITDCVLESSQCFREKVIKREDVYAYAKDLYAWVKEIANDDIGEGKTENA